MKKKIFITRKIPDVAKKILEKENFIVDCPSHEKAISKEELQTAIREYDGILATLYDKITAEMMEEAESLSVISNYAIGLDNIDVAFANSKGIKVYNTPDIVTHSTADLAWAIFLALIRKILPANQYVRKGKWQAWDPSIFWGEELLGKTLGIIGFGRIGKEVARRAFGFGVKVVFYHYRSLQLEEDLESSVQQVSKEHLLENCDYIFLHVPLTDETRGMIHEQTFKAMKKKPVIVNAARGGVINTNDLIKALQEGWIRGAALDVTDPEPIEPDNPLCQMENCLIVPHIGTATYECRTEMAKKAAENIVHHFRQRGD